MSRNTLAAAALLLGLAASSAHAQNAAASYEARTLEQNQRAYVAPRPSQPPMAEAAPVAGQVREKPVAATLPQAGVRRVVLADKAR